VVVAVVLIQELMAQVELVAVEMVALLEQQELLIRAVVVEVLIYLQIIQAPAAAQVL
jgi:hypothetical protein